VLTCGKQLLTDPVFGDRVDKAEAFQNKHNKKEQQCLVSTGHWY